ncbi:hypothetical protein GL279_00485 [Paracoccus limosus]|uniref:Uncharacterized protein n=1 Tax=Paracoccus limosus TaxID=913252 RepID=A0A844GZ54_9RHOB|nr:hypothetical protein [Paracoccus limosus]MTH33075.1 hypothetical protein [Paracoccus limosus]
MSRFTRFSADEIERRRLASVAEMKARDRAEFDRRYQEACDTEYWRYGQCCAGCDHWRSDMGWSGQCAAAGIVSGKDVMQSIGAIWSSYTPPPGLPYTRQDFHCGKFIDTFDWSTLDPDYLTRIGAVRDGSLRPKPTHP